MLKLHIELNMEKIKSMSQTGDHEDLLREAKTIIDDALDKFKDDTLSRVKLKYRDEFVGHVYYDDEDSIPFV